MKNIILGFILIINISWSNEALLKNDPNRPTDKIAKDLEISQSQFIECFNQVNPAPHGQHPDSNQVHQNKNKLLKCLQKANPDITNELLDRVMDRYRPGGHAAQEAISR